MLEVDAINRGALRSLCRDERRAGPLVKALSILGWNDHIDVIRLEPTVHPARAHITQRGCGAGRELALDAEVPLHDVVALGFEIGNVVAVGYNGSR